jgi:hypothetical protein
LFELLEGFVTDAELLMRNGILVLGIVFVGWTWWRTKALTTTMGALLFAAVVIWGVNHFGALSGLVDEDIRDRTGRPTTQSVDPRATR